ncbi:MAG: hypothetical protein GY752_06320 [bacterium]|nr:hypothetical protein [bacterium]MCP4798434.1 hypothetical protein [bacterium]
MYKLFLISLLVVFVGCFDSGPKVLLEMPITSADDSHDENLEFVADVSFDGNGSLVGEFQGKGRSLLLDIDNPDVAGKQVDCKVHLKTEMLSSYLVLEMIIVMPDGKANVVRTHDPLICRTSDWKPLTLTHQFEEGENPEKISYFLFNMNYGKYWADDVTVTIGAAE